MPTFAPYLVVHTKSDCEWCATAKAFLDQHQLFYRVAAHDDEQERYQGANNFVTGAVGTAAGATANNKVKAQGFPARQRRVSTSAVVAPRSPRL
jgi:hypothetical protein